MSLMTLVRLLVLLATGSTLGALGVGAMNRAMPSDASPAFFLPQPASHDVLPVGLPGSQRYDLVDRATGRVTPLRLPGTDRWAAVSVSPWRDERGELQAVGRWVDWDGEGDFSGWGLFRVSDAAVVSRVVLDVLPIHPPCWIPGQPRCLLFSAADGRLYRSRIPPVGGADGIPAPADEAPELTAPQVPVTWRAANPPPDAGEFFLAEPVWSHEPRLRRWVIVALSRRVQPAEKPGLQPSQLWWLEMSDQAEEALSAGPLVLAADVDRGSPRLEERAPTIAVDARGRIRVVYLTRPPGDRTARLCSAALQFDGDTGHPYIKPGDVQPIPQGENLAIAPLLVSTDGSKVFVRDLSGRIISRDLVP